VSDSYQLSNSFFIFFFFFFSVNIEKTNKEIIMKTKGWRIKFEQEEHVVVKFFPDAEFGGEEAAKEAAVDYLTRLLETHNKHLWTRGIFLEHYVEIYRC
jgi:hypothetical protein